MSDRLRAAKIASNLADGPSLLNYYDPLFSIPPQEPTLVRYAHFKSIARPVSKWRRVLVTALFVSHLLPTVAIAQTAVPDDDADEADELALTNTASYSYSTSDGHSVQGFTRTLSNPLDASLLDPRGQILGCGGELLDDYTGFTVSLYDVDPSDPTGSSIGNLIPLTRTELPDNPNNNIPGGISPNTTNLNPYPLNNQDEGEYSFLLDPNRGQLDVGDTYILIVDVPDESIYTQRRVKLEILSITPTANRSLVSYRATSLDGEPISASGNDQLELSETTLISDAERISLQLLALQFAGALCPASQIQITKSGDRANAAPGDTVLYRLGIRNVSGDPLDSTVVTDVLPTGFKFLDNAPRAEIDGEIVPINVERNGMVVTFSTNAVLEADAVLNIVYAAQLTPDAMRGDGRNTATVAAQRVDNNMEVRDGPSVHRVRISPGIVSDCGTILGRVFVDKNFDGEQQPGEPGIPNSVVFMDDGNRITTDADGLFHVKCALPGQRVGALDLTTLPGYTIAPNPYFVERNSPSRLVRLAPGGLVRMNFGVTPTFQEQTESQTDETSGRSTPQQESNQ